MVRDFAEKLRLTAALLNCASQKDLCAAFGRVNPHTDFDLGRSYKWIRGRALPRSARVYQDWAALLDVKRSPAWLASCTLDQFVDVLCKHYPEVERAALLEQAGLTDGVGHGVDDAPTAADGSSNYLCGVFACYSHAQSPYYRGRIVRGALVIQPAPGVASGLMATYSQTIAIGRVWARGEALRFGRTLCLVLQAPSPEMAPVFCNLILPAPPGSVLAGLMSASTAVHPGGQPPYTTRIVMLRVPVHADGLEATNRYMDEGASAPSRDLVALGVAPAAAGGCELDRRVHDFLYGHHGGPGYDQVPLADYVALAGICDQLWLEHVSSAVGARG